MSNSELEHDCIIKYEKILSNRIKIAKEMVKKLPECYYHCIYRSNCRKLSKYLEKIKVLDELMQPRLDKDIRVCREKLVKLVGDCIRQYHAIKKCIYVHKDDLTLEKGYRIWEW